MQGWPFVDLGVATLFGCLRFEVFHVYIADPVAEDLLWKNTAASAYNFQLVQLRLKDLSEEVRQLEKQYMQEGVPADCSDLFQRLFAQVYAIDLNTI